MIQVLIVDDEVHAQNLLENLLQASGFELEIVQKCSNLREAVSYVKMHSVDLVFLDVEMPLENGTKINEYLLEEERPDIIFVTAYDSFAIEAIRLGAFDYLVKPIDRQLLHKALDRYFEKRLKEKARQQIGKLSIATHKGTLLINYKDIICLKANGSYTEIITTTKSIIASKPIRYFEDRIPPLYVRIHRSHIVNKYKVKQLIRKDNNWWVSLEGTSDELPVSKKYMSNLEQLGV